MGSVNSIDTKVFLELDEEFRKANAKDRSYKAVGSGRSKTFKPLERAYSSIKENQMLAKFALIHWDKLCIGDYRDEFFLLARNFFHPCK